MNTNLEIHQRRMEGSWREKKRLEEQLIQFKIFEMSKWQELNCDGAKKKNQLETPGETKCCT